jgi:hypothetical protein
MAGTQDQSVQWEALLSPVVVTLDSLSTLEVCSNLNLVQLCFAGFVHWEGRLMGGSHGRVTWEDHMRGERLMASHGGDAHCGVVDDACSMWCFLPGPGPFKQQCEHVNAAGSSSDWYGYLATPLLDACIGTGGKSASIAGTHCY